MPFNSINKIQTKVMNYSYFIGIDISKEWFDAAIRQPGKPRYIRHKQFANTEKGFQTLLKWLKQNGIKDFSLLSVCMEHTGVYTVPLCQFLGQKGIIYTLVPGAQIANSQGITRGKSDKLDAKRIAAYALKNREEIIIHTLPSEEIRTLKTLLAYRERLLKAKHAFLVSTKEIKAFETKVVANTISDSSKLMIEQCNQQIKQVDKQISQCIEAHPELAKNYKLLLSVPGIGRQNALYMMVFTKNFVCFNCPKKFAAYAGIAPFKKSSGKSLNSGSKVSHKANKKMKALLSTAVANGLSSCSEYQIYYDKQLQKGKNKFSIKNVIRNKIVARAFAVIKRNSKYVNMHAFAA